MSAILGVGIDLVRIDRIQAVAERWRERFLERVFTPTERQYAFACAQPYPRLAARFAVKEAVFKALGTGWGQGLQWTEIETTAGAHGRPQVRVRGRAEGLLRQRGVRAIEVSLSHDGEYAIAQVILVS